MPTWHYGVLLEAPAGGWTPLEEVAVQWEADGQQQRITLKALGRVEWLSDGEANSMETQEDQAQALLAELHRRCEVDVTQADRDGHDAVLVSVEDVREEAEAFRWLCAEVAA